MLVFRIYMQERGIFYRISSHFTFGTHSGHIRVSFGLPKNSINMQKGTNEVIPIGAYFIISYLSSKDYLSLSGALSIKSMNWSSLGVMMI